MFFQKKSLEFLLFNSLNNNKAWFIENKCDYDEFLLKPFIELVKLLTPVMLLIDKDFVVKPQINKTISSIYRDCRFSKGIIFRDTMWCVFKRPKSPDYLPPAFFLEISPLKYRFGMGYYKATKNTMDILRGLVIKGDDSFKKALISFKCQDDLAIEGEASKKKITANNSDEINWINKKNIYFVKSSTDLTFILEDGLENRLTSEFEKLIPIYDLFLKVEKLCK